MTSTIPIVALRPTHSLQYPNADLQHHCPSRAGLCVNFRMTDTTGCICQCPFTAIEWREGLSNGLVHRPDMTDIAAATGPILKTDPTSLRAITKIRRPPDTAASLQLKLREKQARLEEGTPENNHGISETTTQTTQLPVVCRANFLHPQLDIHSVRSSADTTSTAPSSSRRIYRD